MTMGGVRARGLCQGAREWRPWSGCLRQGPFHSRSYPGFDHTSPLGSRLRGNDGRSGGGGAISQRPWSLVRMMSVPRPAIPVDTVTAPCSPARSTMSDSCDGLDALRSRCGMPCRSRASLNSEDSLTLPNAISRGLPTRCQCATSSERARACSDLSKKTRVSRSTRRAGKVEGTLTVGAP